MLLLASGCVADLSYYYNLLLSCQVVSDPVGYGFVIRGNSPVYVHSVDPMGPAAAAGLNVSQIYPNILVILLLSVF